MDNEKEPVLEDWMTPNPITIPSDKKVGEALVLMFERDIRHLPVMEQDGLVGIISDRDIRQFLGRGGVSFEDPCEDDRYLNLAVRKIMSMHPITVCPTTLIPSALKLMLEHKIGALLVLEGGDSRWEVRCLKRV